MKQSEFLELLNLYLDHEISATDAARLEAEVAQSPARHRLYRQYCMMQKACATLTTVSAEEFSEGKNIVAFETPRRSNGVYYAAGLAAAACLALVVVFKQRTGSSTESVAALEVVAKDVPTETAAPAREIASTVTLAIPRNELQPVFSARRVSSYDAPQDLVPLRHTFAEGAPDFAWMKNVQFNPAQRVSAESLLFKGDVKFNSENTVRRTILSPAEVESAAFEFGR